MKEFVLFGKVHQSIYFMSTILLKDNINWVSVPQFKLTYIHDTIHPSQKN